jgi:hypothetical protein
MVAGWRGRPSRSHSPPSVLFPEPKRRWWAPWSQKSEIGLGGEMSDTLSYYAMAGALSVVFAAGCYTGFCVGFVVGRLDGRWFQKLRRRFQ